MLRLALVLGAATLASAQHIALSPNSTIPSSQIVSGLQQHCPAVKLTLDQAKADYVLEAKGPDKQHDQNKNHVTLFAPNGDAVYSSEAFRVSNAVKDVCQGIATLSGTGSAKHGK
jgi:hypothetical protein